MIVDSFRNEYEGEWVVDEKIERARELAKQYHSNCDTFDNYYIAGKKLFEPGNFSKCNRNALRERKIYMDACLNMGLTYVEAQKILSQMA